MPATTPDKLPDKLIVKSFEAARDQYAALGVDVQKAMDTLKPVPVSLHCWQGDDVGGFEKIESGSGGGIQATGNYPGKASTPDELRADLEQVFALLPGSHRLNLHAIYGEFGGKAPDRNAITPEHFQGWIDWAKQHGAGLDFNPTCFAHPKADDGFTLSHTDPTIRQFWIEHCIACRKIGAAMGKALGSPCVTNIWVPDGWKDTPVDRKGPRERLQQSLDAVLAQEFDKQHLLDAVEGKLFGLGLESYTVGSHEFYLAYAVSRGIMVCLDAGHYHPTESLADKISSVLLHVDEILLHVSRGVRWDSDHVVTLTDELRAIAEELVRGDFLKRTHIGLDFFDASINRVAAWTIGARNMLKALLQALLEPTAKLRELENSGDLTARLAMLEESKLLPFGAVWDYYCVAQGVPPGGEWVSQIKSYEKKVLAGRS